MTSHGSVIPGRGHLIGDRETGSLKQNAASVPAIWRMGAWSALQSQTTEVAP
ncbi:hypothetical protein [Parvibaculum sp.]|uniref:hypothetical protein n=1 Tax=Parvibaculum sp. TaxID=2024848 RepID=UPI0025E70BC0|nr:hypothetical protein [Parvibaculum sp.]